LGLFVPWLGIDLRVIPQPEEDPMRVKRCPYCKTPFTPHPKVRHRQKTVGSFLPEGAKEDNNAAGKRTQIAVVTIMPESKPGSISIRAT